MLESSTSPQHVRLLAIDDSAEIRDLFQLLFEEAGYEVRVAADGRAGLEEMRSLRPDIVVTDISMPGMNGLEFLVQLRSQFAPPLPPVIVCSGFDVTADEALRLGAARFLPKPILPRVLIKTVEEVLRNQAVDQSHLTQERESVRQSRVRATATAARLLASVDLRHPDVARVLTRFVQVVADYFGHAKAAITLVTPGGEMYVPAVSRGSVVAAGTTLSGNLLYTSGVLTSGASLVLCDWLPFAAALSDARMAALGIRFLVSVPLLFTGVPVGSLCLVDREPHSFGAEDLLILEQVARDASAEFWPISSISRSLGFVSQTVFDRMLGAELSLLHRERGSVELLLVDIDPVADSELALALLAHGGTRMALCRRDGGLLAVLKRDRDSETARRTISGTFNLLSKCCTVRAASWISLVDRGLPLVPQQVLVQLSRAALGESRSARMGKLERIIIGCEDPPAEASPAPAQS